MTQNPSNRREIVHFDSLIELTIHAPRERVWEAMVREIGEWWPRDFYFTQGPNEFVLEAKAGGRVYEKSESGAELLWGNILALVPNESLTWHAIFAPPYSGPASSSIHLALTDGADGATTFTLTQHYIGVESEGQKASLDDGWTQIFDVAFRAHVEG